ncbi:MAG: beta-lactamase family protein [Chloroflexi bacterium]|nr:beta-lactamase family protein [Chloroflexota bacterium]
MLDAPIQTYLPQIPLDIAVTVRRLLNHTGGIPDYGGLPAYYEALKADPTRPWTPDEFLTATLTEGLVFIPGEDWRYSNIGFLLLRQVIETVRRTSLRTALQERIFAPLGLRRTFVAQTLDDARQLTPGYSAFFAPDDSLQDIQSLYHPGWVSHGVVISTASDLALVIDALFTGRLITSQSRDAMFEAVDVAVDAPFFRHPSYGLGVMIDHESRYGVMAGHGGGGPGYSAGALDLPDVHGRWVTSVALANRDGNDLGLEMAFTMGMIVGDMLG